MARRSRTGRAMSSTSGRSSSLITGYAALISYCVGTSSPDPYSCLAMKTSPGEVIIHL
jgi:hypothetical protein